MKIYTKLFFYTTFFISLTACGGSGGGEDNDGMISQEFNFATQGVVDLVVGDTVTNIASGEGTGAVTYSSTDVNVATVDGGGLVVALSAGTASIVAEILADDTYTSATASYELNVETPQLTDTDGDGLTDSEEEIAGTNADRADTDGDGFSDLLEVQSGGFHPLVADLPKLSIDISSAPLIQLHTTFTDGEKTEADYSVTLEQGQESSYSKSDTQSTSSTTKNTKSIKAEVEVKYPPAGSAKVTAKASTSKSVTREKSTSVNRESSQSSRNEFSERQNDERSATSATDTGSLSVGLTVTNISDVRIDLSEIKVIAMKPAVSSDDIQQLGTLVPVGEFETVSLGLGGEVTLEMEDTTPSVPLLKELMANPSGLQFVVSQYQMINVGNNEELIWSALSQDVSERTAQVVIDYGDNIVDGDSVHQFMVATDIKLNEQLEYPGVLMSDVLDILDISYTTSAQDDSEQPTADTKEVLTGVEGINTNLGATPDEVSKSGFWYVFSSSDSLDDPDVDFTDIVLKARDRISMVYVADLDLDGIFNREEHLLGTRIDFKDTDGDGLSDLQEAKEGWLINVNGEARRVYSDPLNPDTDQDGLTDSEEVCPGYEASEPDEVACPDGTEQDPRPEIVSDPTRADTDGDGDWDDVDEFPLGDDPRLALEVSFSGESEVITASGSLVPNSGGALESIEINWGDGSGVQSFTNVGPDGNIVFSNAVKEYSSPGAYSVTVTGTGEGVSDVVQDYVVTVFDVQSSGAIGAMLQVNGWTEINSQRVVADINNDDRDDIVGFGTDGTYVSLGSEDGFQMVEKVSDSFGISDKTTESRHLAYADGDEYLDIVAFNQDGVYVAVNDRAGGFYESELWSNDFGVNDGYSSIANYPRLLGDINGDDVADIVGFNSADEIYISYGQGNQFATAVLFDDSIYQDIVDRRCTTRLANGVCVTSVFTDPNPDSIPPYQFPKSLADVNGDGLMDIVMHDYHSTFVWLSAQDGEFGFEPQPVDYDYFQFRSGWRTETGLLLYVDLNDDGYADITGFGNSEVVTAYGDSDGLRAAYEQITDQIFVANDWSKTDDFRYFADVNADGLLDIIGFGIYENEALVVYILNQGDGTFSDPIRWTSESGLFPEGSYTTTDNPRYVADVNGDGYADIVAFADEAIRVVFGTSVARQ